ncbi:uncharacterized protein Z520_05700 [Fonsecaea multimorphosa CBS 102226]|uniref:EthD domain-containing protein n=1 Tax=Fonsecaea multimorphosa CBS 102226 TaxID=1442371 RepID=A0A0D2K5J0_9EURO|nr:uncharacterized protein Z520_05700 [Fonsecaea multimorphosa CBS 102226]KIX98399.1 hypothetical protein Z520_05700 [Fonsecaea multimorphosa CBS 102226]OAL24593.1 hypothetical protein AYO22_05382 [Fonsecaea multimorphosa]
MATKQKVMRVCMYLKRKPGLTEEEFNHYWSHVHGPLVRPLVEKYGILKYTQYHTSSNVQQSTMEAWPELKALDVTPYDGVAEFLVKDIEGIKKSRDDPLFHEKIRPDEENFFDVKGMAWTIGWEEVYVLDGKIVPDSEAWKNTP